MHAQPQSESTTTALQWYVVRTHQGDEPRAEANLASGGIGTFGPRIAARRGSGSVPLFPQYIFARFDLGASLQRVRFTRGVQGIVTFGGSAASVDDDVIATLQSRVDATNGLVTVGRRLNAGDRVRIEAGAFASLTGVIERPPSARERVVVLLTSVAAALRVDVPVDCVYAE